VAPKIAEDNLSFTFAYFLLFFNFIFFGQNPGGGADD
jgi:hypothetical protein